MKKWIALLLALTLVLSLSACGSSGSAPTEPEKNEISDATLSQDAGSTADTTPTTEYVPVIDRAPSNGWDASLEIAAIAPVTGIYTQTSLSYQVRFDYLVCQCITTDGSAVYLYLTVDDYLETFDAEASVNTAYFAYSEMVVFENPLHIDGTYLDANTIVDDLSSTIGADKVIHLGDVAPSSATISEVDYTANTDALTCVKAEIVSIVPGYTLKSGDAITTTDVVCSAKTADGQEIWIAMSVEDYNTHFDPDASLALSSMASFDTVTFDSGVTLHGVAIAAENVASGLADAIGCGTVFYFARKG